MAGRWAQWGDSAEYSHSRTRICSSIDTSLEVDCDRCVEHDTYTCDGENKMVFPFI